MRRMRRRKEQEEQVIVTIRGTEKQKSRSIIMKLAEIDYVGS
jgi:hypothetical protein